MSSNTALLHAASLVAPPGVTVAVYDGLASLPYFNPDWEYEENAAVMNWRIHLNAADGIVISTPEYAHGIPGVLKNALDWVVGSGEFVADISHP